MLLSFNFGREFLESPNVVLHLEEVLHLDDVPLNIDMIGM